MFLALIFIVFLLLLNKIFLDASSKPYKGFNSFQITPCLSISFGGLTKTSLSKVFTCKKAALMSMLTILKLKLADSAIRSLKLSFAAVGLSDWDLVYLLETFSY